MGVNTKMKVFTPTEAGSGRQDAISHQQQAAKNGRPRGVSAVRLVSFSGTSQNQSESVSINQYQSAAVGIN